MAVPPPSSKAAMRRALRLVRERHRGDDAAIRARLLPLVREARTVAGYVAHRGEPDILPVLAAVIVSGRAAVLPQVVGPAEMRFVGWNPADRLTPGHAGIGEPIGDSLARPDLVLAPLVGFDRAGRRLGQGGGYYDRWFADHADVRRIGIAWSVQEVDVVPVDDWDVHLHAIVTERETIVP